MLPDGGVQRPHEGRHPLPRRRLLAVHRAVQLLAAELLGHAGQRLHPRQRADGFAEQHLHRRHADHPDHEGRGLQPVRWPDRQPRRRALSLEYAKKDYDKFLEQAHEIMPDDHADRDSLERQVRDAPRPIEPTSACTSKRIVASHCRWTTPFDTDVRRVCSSCVRSWAKIQYPQGHLRRHADHGIPDQLQPCVQRPDPVRDRRLWSRHRLVRARDPARHSASTASAASARSTTPPSSRSSSSPSSTA